MPKGGVIYYPDTRRRAHILTLTKDDSILPMLGNVTHEFAYKNRQPLCLRALGNILPQHRGGSHLMLLRGGELQSLRTLFLIPNSSKRDRE
jgi:hypothetical protein